MAEGPVRIVALAGSLRRRSFNAALLRAAADLAPSGCEIEIATFRGFPVYDGDLEAEQGPPEAVERLKEQVAAADGLLIASPEYNHSIPGPLKNAIDWLSRPPKDIPRVFGGRPVGVIGATPGGAGTRYAQLAWLPIFRTLGMHPYLAQSLYVARAAQVFDGDLRLTDEDIRERLVAYLEGFARFIRCFAG